jgi:glycosyltransferase involved in cell wall biosynthesis
MPPLVVGIDARELQDRPTGTGRYLRSLLRVWTRDSPDRFVAYFNGPAPADPMAAHPRVRSRPIGDRPLPRLAWEEWHLPREARADGIDVFFSPAYTCPLRLRVPRVTAVHDLAYFSCPEDFGLAHALRRRVMVALSLHASRRILACSDFTRREIVARFPALAGRVLHVPLGRDEDLPAAPAREEARRRLGVAGPFVITVGSVFNRRRVPELLRSVAVLRAHHPDLILDVVGDIRTTPRLDLARLVRGLGLETRVRLSGFVDEAGLADRYAAADAAVFLSEYEGFGLPALEAASRGVPLVVSQRPALTEVVGDCALLVDPRNEGEIARALDLLLADPALRRRLIERGREVAARYSWARTAILTRRALAAAVNP